jgi:3-phytase
MKINPILPALLLILGQSCNQTGTQSGLFSGVMADVETAAVRDKDDAADDPAIWIHPEDPSRSLLICSNKKSGIVVYNLQGIEVGNYPVGLINNVDVRQGISLNDSISVDIAAGSNRTDNSIALLEIRPDGTLRDIAARRIMSNFSEVYGFCLYHDLAARTVYAIVNNKEGYVEQWRLFGTADNKLDAELSRTFRAGETQLEGCVGDDELGFLYIGEEDKGFWKFRAHPDSAARGTLVDDLSNTALKDDIEGLTIFYKPDRKGYLIASSQGNNSFAVYTREGSNEYLGSFEIVDGPKTDGVSETDGIDVTSASLGSAFPSGLFIAQDGYNFDGESAVNQNFKLVSWEKISKSLNLK